MDYSHRLKVSNMNCSRCNLPLESEARFCRNCGLPVSPVSSQSNRGNIEQVNKQGIEGDQTVLPSSWELQQSRPVQSHYPPKTYQPTVAVSSNPGNVRGPLVQAVSPSHPTRRKNRLVQVLLILLGVLLVLALLFAGGWFFLLRPYLHGVAQNEVDTVFSNATNLINPLAVSVVAATHAPVVITENDANNFIGANSSQSGPIQQSHLSITPQGLRMDFQAYGLTSTITGVPRIVNGQIVMTDVAIQGPASLIMSPDELTSEVNADLQQVSAAMQRPITRLTLKDQEIDIKLG